MLTAHPYRIAICGQYAGLEQTKGIASQNESCKCCCKNKDYQWKWDEQKNGV